MDQVPDVNSQFVIDSNGNNTNLCTGIYYLLHIKDQEKSFFTITNEKSASGHFMQIAYYEKKEDDCYWHFIPREGHPGEYIISNKADPNSFATYTDKKSASGKYCQLVSKKIDEEWSKYCYWKFVPTDIYGFYHLRNTSIPNSFITWTAEKSASGHYLQVCDYAKPKDHPHEHYIGFVPYGYKLHAKLSQFVFEPNYLEMLRSMAKPNFNSVQEIEVKDENLNSKIGGVYETSITESFSWSTKQKLGTTVVVAVGGGVPLPGFAIGGGVAVAGSYEFEKNKKWSHSETRKYSATVEMSPTKPGRYRIGNIVYVVEDAEIPYTARAVLTAYLLPGDKVLAAPGVEALFHYDGLNATIIERRYTEVIVEVSGSLKATYGLFTKAVSERITD
eukprot:TRINITY_DN87_c0_g1_i1.p1 TRINITY_DN87_c0_g1~~TRINITY_DN87_c0_g1_i1.p1  ORF type:complete len:407 (-),score=82.36 TRINITY_DN87_c0_g1_i1:41-1207(-)